MANSLTRTLDLQLLGEGRDPLKGKSRKITEMPDLACFQENHGKSRKITEILEAIKNHRQDLTLIAPYLLTSHLPKITENH